LFALSSCVDESYDLSKDISLDMNVGGKAFSIPIGSTAPIKLSDMIDESGVLKSDASGQYVLSESDDFDPVDVAIDPVILEVDEVNLDPVELDFLPVLDGVSPVPGDVVVTLPYPISATVDQTGSFHINEVVPDELITIRTIELNRESPATYEVSLRLDGLPEGLGDMTFEDFRLILPDFLVFSEEDHVVDGVLTLESGFNPYQGFSKELTVTGVDFSKLNSGEGLEMQKVNGKNRLIINVQVSLKGTLTIQEATIDPDQLDHVTLIPEVTMTSLHAERFTGMIDPHIDPVREAISLDLDEDLDFLQEDGVVLDVSNPQILLTVGNTIGIPLNLHVKMYAKNRHGQVIDRSQVEETTLQIKAAEVDGEVTETSFLFSRQGSSRQGYEAVQISDLANLVKVVPDSIILEMTGEADQTVTHHIDLGKALQVTGSYEVMVPLQFNAFRIHYKDTITGLTKDLEDISDKLKNGEWQLKMTAENTVPVELTLDVVPLDVDGNEISGVSATVSETIAAGHGHEAEAVKTPITITLKSQDGKLPLLESLAIEITAENESGSGAVSFNANQSLRLTGMKLITDGGFDLDLNE
jgi:hypothetical protein